MNLYNTDHTAKPNRGILGELRWHGESVKLHRECLELRAEGRNHEWESYSQLALAILAQAFEDAIGSSPRHTRPKGEILRDREDAILLLRSMDGNHYHDRLTWLEIAHPQSDPRHMDRILQSRLDARGLPRV